MTEQSPASVSPRPSAFRRVVLVLTVALTIVSLVSIVAVLVEYFAQLEVSVPFMGVALWGLPLAFLGMVLLVILSMLDRRRTSS